MAYGLCVSVLICIQVYDTYIYTGQREVYLTFEVSSRPTTANNASAGWAKRLDIEEQMLACV